jgi:hypothetical protein
MREAGSNVFNSKMVLVTSGGISKMFLQRSVGGFLLAACTADTLSLLSKALRSAHFGTSFSIS